MREEERLEAVATMKDVANAADVSVSTVSHVINGTRFVSDDVTTRVLDAMSRLDYRPNGLARSLRMGRTHVIGLIVPDNTNQFFAEVARATEDVGFSNGYSVVLCNGDDRLDKQTAYIEALVDRQVDGIILIASGDLRSVLDGLTSLRIPVVVADRELPGVAVDTVLIDNELGGCLATRYLLSLGHRRIGCIAGPEEIRSSVQRVDGYRRALTEAELDLEPSYIVRGDFHFSGGEQAMRLLLALAEPPTAVFICNDMMAIGAMRAIHSFGRHIPDDLSIVGFDDIPLASATFPALTTVAQPTSEMASVAADLLLRRIQGRGGDEPQRIMLEPRLIVRESSCARRGLPDS